MVGNSRRVPKGLDQVTVLRILEAHMGGELLASPPTSRPPMALGCPVTENAPMPGRPIRPVSRWQLMIALTLSVPDDRLVDPL